MIEIKDKTLCCGCTACSSICPQKCIKMEADEEGFLYPKVEKEECVNCGLCDKVCAVKNKKEISDYNRILYAVRSKDENVLKKSSSGGMFVPISNLFLKKGGVVCAARFDDNFNVVHSFIDGNTTESLSHNNSFSGSKYVQSFLGHTFSSVKKYLDEGRDVVFFGTPCQVEGLKSFLVKPYDSLFTVDMVCFGTPSALLWRKYLDYQKKKYGSEIESLSFKSKVFGYHSGGMMDIRFQNGKRYISSARADMMMKCFVKKISLRPSCYECSFKKIEHCSDLTIFDCWHFNKLTGKKDDNKGYTNVIVHSRYGAQIVDELDFATIKYPIEMDKAVEFDGIMIKNCALKHPDRDRFYENINNEDLKVHVNRFVPITKKDMIIERIKKLLYLGGILQKVRKRNS